MGRSVGGGFYKATGTARTAEQTSRGRGVHRGRNIAVGRALGKAGFWRRLWR